MSDILSFPKPGILIIPNKIKLYSTSGVLRVIGCLGAAMIPKQIFIKHNCLIVYTLYFRYIMSFLNNSIKGVKYGHIRWLVLKGTDYKMVNTNRGLEFKLGFSHNIFFHYINNITISLQSNTKLKIKSICLQHVSLIAKRIESLKLPDPYNGRGILCRTHVPVLKAGKRK